MKTIDTCLSPELIHLYDLNEKVVVVIDIFRATSVMVTAMSNGVNEIVALSEVDDCRAYRDKNYLIAGERGGAKIEDFDLGNSPLAFLNSSYVGRNLAMTTTNGTKAINRSLSAESIVIGAFLNFQAVVSFIKASNRSLVLHCAGWKGKPNFEDTLFAGAVVKALGKSYEKCDATIMAEEAYEDKSDKMLDFLMSSSHVKRLSKINASIKDDIIHCCTWDLYDKVPQYKNGILI